MIRHILLLTTVSLLGISRLTAQQEVRTTSDDPRVLVRAGQKTTFGSGQTAVTDYLVRQELIPDESIAFKRAVYQLLIDHTGKVTEASLFHGGLTPGLETTFSKAFLDMPSWKTSIQKDQLSVVLVVVTIKKQEITTELY